MLMKRALRELLKAEWEFMLATVRIQNELESLMDNMNEE